MKGAADIREKELERSLSEANTELAKLRRELADSEEEREKLERRFADHKNNANREIS